MSHHWQRELLDSMYPLATATADKLEAKLVRRAASQRSRHGSTDGGEHGCYACDYFVFLSTVLFVLLVSLLVGLAPASTPLLQGWFKRRANKLFNTWKKVYGELTANDFTLRPEPEVG
jgi:hypothetical protein